MPSWNPKPNAPAEVREASSRRSQPACQACPSASCCQRPLLGRAPMPAAAMRTGDNAHSSSGYYMLTGVPHQPMNAENVNPGAPDNWPCSAAVARSVQQSSTAFPAPSGPCPITFLIPTDRSGPARMRAFWDARAIPGYSVVIPPPPIFISRNSLCRTSYRSIACRAAARC